jgi:hypothetical protein
MMKKRIARSPTSTVRISVAGTWWSTKRVRKLSDRVAAVGAEAMAVVVVVAEAVAAIVADVVVAADAAVIAGTVVTAATAGRIPV